MEKEKNKKKHENSFYQEQSNRKIQYDAMLTDPSESISEKYRINNKILDEHDKTKPTPKNNEKLTDTNINKTRLDIAENGIVIKLKEENNKNYDRNALNEDSTKIENNEFPKTAIPNYVIESLKQKEFKNLETSFDKCAYSLDVVDINSLLNDNEMITDKILENIIDILTKEFKNIKSDSICGASQSTQTITPLDNIEQKFIQILNINQNHWIMLTNNLFNKKNIRSKSIYIDIYDSNCTSLNKPLEKEAIRYIKKKYQHICYDNFIIRYKKCNQQVDNFSCGLHAIANTLCIAMGLNPCNIDYKTSEIKNTITSMLKKYELEMFPYSNKKNIETNDTLYTINIPNKRKCEEHNLQSSNNYRPSKITKTDHQKLTKEEHDILTHNYKINSSIIDNLLRLIKKLKNITIYESIFTSNYTEKLKPLKHLHEKYIAIVNNEKGNGHHWFVISNLRSDKSNTEKTEKTTIYDSAFKGKIYKTVVDFLTKIYKDLDIDQIIIKVKPVQQQNDNNSCGIFSLANTLALVNEIEPSSCIYNIDMARNDIAKRIQNQNLNMINYSKTSPKIKDMIYIVGIKCPKIDHPIK